VRVPRYNAAMEHLPHLGLTFYQGRLELVECPHGGRALEHQFVDLILAAEMAVESTFRHVHRLIGSTDANAA
jgi:hypothetical protein